MIVDYGMGNLSSVERKLKRVGAEVVVTSEPSRVESADKLILPGVGHFSKAMENLRERSLIEPLNEAVLGRKAPILGICLGLQLMTNRSEEGEVAGLGWFEAEVIRFEVEDKLKHKVPHTGWNQVELCKQSRLFERLDGGTEFYFVHAYHLKVDEPSDVLNRTVYEYSFPSALEKDNIFGVQYHPEKSHSAGETLLKNFVEL